MASGASVRVRVRLGGGLAAAAGFTETEATVESSTSLAELAGLVGVSPSMVMLYAVNGTVREPTYPLKDGDEVLLVPAVSGGQHEA